MPSLRYQRRKDAGEMSRTKHRMLAALLVGLAVAAVQGVSVPAASAGTVSRPGATPAAFAQGPPASAADLARVKTLAAGDDFGCEGSWRFISASNGKRWKVDASSDWVYADGTPGVEDWKQWFLFCRRASWQSDRYVLYANQGGRFVHTNTASLQLGAYGSLVDDTANSFYWRTYD